MTRLRKANKTPSTKALPKTLKMVYGAVGLDSNPFALVDLYLTVKTSLASVASFVEQNDVPKRRKSESTNVITGGALVLASLTVASSGFSFCLFAWRPI